MKKRNVLIVSILFATTPLIFTACHKNDDNDNNNVDVTQLKKDILTDAATKVCEPSYVDLSTQSGQLLVAVQAFNATPTDVTLKACQDLWKSIRQTWEQSEAWLIGPVESDNIDPRIDTWPVDFNELETILAGSQTLDENYVENLEESLKGFHPIEYLLWGQDGTKVAADFTPREKDFLLALTQNLNNLAGEVKTSWTSGYTTLLATAGASGNATYPTSQSAFEALVDGMAGICEEVANAKMKDPFDLQDPSQEESPFAKNSIIDFTNNIKGILAMYQGKFTADGKGIEDLVRNYNLSLDDEIKTKHAAAIAALQAITMPFGQAISGQQSQVVAAMAKINELADALTTKLRPFVQQYGVE